MSDASPFERLPIVPCLTHIIDFLDFNDCIALSLTSKTMMVDCFMAAEGRYGDFEDEYDALALYKELMHRLRRWVPSDIRFCHHCLYYLPLLSFGPGTHELETLACMSCRFHTSHSFTDNLTNDIHTNCIGCSSLEDAVLEYLEDGDPSLDQDKVWALMNGAIDSDSDLTLTSGV